MGLSGQRVAIIGGTSGIGYAVAEAAAAEGAAVVVASRDKANIEGALNRLPAGVEGAPVDTTDEDSVRAFFAGIGEVDHLVYTAGDHIRMRPLAQLDLADARGQFNLFWGALTAVKHGAEAVRQSITLTTGVVGSRPSAGTAVSSGVTGAVESLTRALAVELAPKRVNAVRLGPVPTVENPDLPNAAALYKMLGEQLLAGRVGRPPEAAAAYLYLMQGTFTTGTVLPTDGGYVLVANPKPPRAPERTDA